MMLIDVSDGMKLGIFTKYEFLVKMMVQLTLLLKPTDKLSILRMISKF